MVKKEQKVSKKKDEVVINLDSFAIPIAIIVAGVIIALGIFLSNRNNSNADTNTDTSTNTDTTSASSKYDDATTTIDDDPYLGNKDTAKVAVVMFSDYLCPYCQTFEESTLPDIKTNFVDTGDVLFVYRDFPLSFHGDITYQAAYAGECVHNLGGNDAFATFHSEAYMVSTEDQLRTFAQNLGINMTSYDSCVADETYKSEVTADFDAGSEAGVTGTPGFVVGKLSSDGTVDGVLIEGAYPYTTFEAVINEMLAE